MGSVPHVALVICNPVVPCTVSNTRHIDDKVGVSGKDLSLMATIGRIPEIQAENESTSAYLERVQLFSQQTMFVKGSKSPFYCLQIGGKTYVLLRDLLAPVKAN